MVGGVTVYPPDQPQKGHSARASGSTDQGTDACTGPPVFLRCLHFSAHRLHSLLLRPGLLHSAGHTGGLSSHGLAMEEDGEPPRPPHRRWALGTNPAVLGTVPRRQSRKGAGVGAWQRP